MLYLLDTNAFIAFFNDDGSAVARRIRRCNPNEIGISVIVMHELYYGAFNSGRVEKNVSAVDDLQFQVLSFNKEDARHAGEIRASLKKSGSPIGHYDILIAGQARARNLVLITANVREFARVKGLAWQDWSK